MRLKKFLVILMVVFCVVLCLLLVYVVEIDDGWKSRGSLGLMICLSLIFLEEEEEKDRLICVGYDFYFFGKKCDFVVEGDKILG